MFLDEFFNQNDGLISINAEQASYFAKAIAGDFNPIHDIDAKRFCVPGDLLFALLLMQNGLRSQMDFRFADMVAANKALRLPPASDCMQIVDDNDKLFLQADARGELSQSASQIEQFIRRYVAFSGLNFVHIMMPLMREQGVMINAARPLVIYERMGFSLSTLAFDEVELSLVDARLSHEGKRGQVDIDFAIHAAGQLVGNGYKRLLLSGLRPFEEESVAAMCDEYARRANQFNPS
ncbi:DUF3581 domain-containing protein [Shewanella sp. NIFS-20-20]|nr:DUF3581 family protein [Shewanella sp. NIFS-20-20]MBV7314143.1 DUF3581 domain-containing protein [Shewanella sp. NIFS-20-20]